MPSSSIARGDLLRFLRKAAICVVSLCLLDTVAGGFSRFVFFGQRSGKFCRINKAMASANQRLFVFGSSHAASHYVPSVLEKETGMPSYNAGVLGQQILFHKTLESIILQRITPEVIVLDVDPSTLYQSTEPYDRLSDLKPFYYRYPEIIGPVLDHRSRMERLYMRSKLYQYNSTLAHVIRYAVAPQHDWNGYRPEFSAMSPPTPEQEREELDNRLAYGADRQLDPVMVDAFERFGEEAQRKGVRVFYFISPGALPYDLEKNASFFKISEIVKRSSIPFFNFRNHPEFLRNYSLFSDSMHLNDAGARRYSRMVAEIIRNSCHYRRAAFLLNRNGHNNDGHRKFLYPSCDPASICAGATISPKDPSLG